MTEPVRAQSERIQTIDFVRGLVLFGLLVINSQTYSLFGWLRPQQVYGLRLDRPDTYVPTQFFIYLLVNGQVVALSSLLSGLCFYLFWQKSTLAGRQADRLIKRWLVLLFIIGGLHALLFWYGDRLHLYTLLGFSLLYFTHKPVVTVLKWIGGLFAFGLVWQGLSVWCFSTVPAPPSNSLALVDPGLMQTLDRWAHGSPLAVVSEQYRRFIQLHGEAIQQLGLAPYIQSEIMALLGLVVGKLQLINRVAFVKRQLLNNAFWVFPLALLLKAIACLHVADVHLLAPDQWLNEQLMIRLADFISTPVLSLIYLTELSLLAGYLPTRLRGWISNTGRLSLTNYLVQTGVCMGLFYGYGLGLSGRLTLLESFLPLIGVYGLQIVWSTLWLSYYAQGPIEWLARRWIYGQAQPLNQSPVYEEPNTST